MAAESGDAQLAELGAALLSRADELSQTMLALVRRDVSFHRTFTLVSDDQLRATRVPNSQVSTANRGPAAA